MLIIEDGRLVIHPQMAENYDKVNMQSKQEEGEELKREQ